MDISSITSTLPVQKPAKINNDREQSNRKQQQPESESEELPEQQDGDDSMTHIDEIV